MIFDFIKQKFNERRDKKSIQKYLKNIFEPGKDFLKNSQFLFTGEIAKRRAIFATPDKTVSSRLFFKYAAGIAAALLFITSSASVYADQTDVSPESPLYPFKKLSENIQLSLASNKGKIALYEKFAERRVKEIEKIDELVGEKSEKETERIKEIKEKIKEDFKDKVVKIEDKNIEGTDKMIGSDNIAVGTEKEIKDTEQSKLCDLNFENIENGEGRDFWKKSEKLEKFKEKCDEHKKTNLNQSGNVVNEGDKNKETDAINMQGNDKSEKNDNLINQNSGEE